MDEKKTDAKQSGRFGPSSSTPSPPFTIPSRQAALSFLSRPQTWALFFSALFMLCMLAGASGAGTQIFGWSVPSFFDRFLPAPVSNGAVMPPDTTWFRLSMIVIILNATMGAIGYTLGGMLGPQVSAWSKQFLYSAAKSAFIVLFIFAGFNITTCQGAGGSATSGTICVGFLQIERAVSFTETIRNTIGLEFGTMTAATAVLSTFLNITPYFRPAGIIGISFSLSPAFRPLFDALGILLSLLSVATGEWFVQSWLLLFIKGRMLSLFLPVGLFLRAWAFPRAGDALIAIAVGFFFVYPFMLNVSAYAIQNYLVSEYGTAQVVQASGNHGFYTDFSACTAATRSQGQSVVCFFKLGSQGAFDAIKSLTRNISPGGGLLAFGLVQLLTGALPNAIVVSLLILYTLAMLKVSIFYVLVVSIIIPLFILFIVLTVIKEIAGFLGTQMDFSAFEKLI
ncbi:Uncharacterised protein [uncultured archaeon]|nr:Uncharacterised protein [uncultured archaeon]